MGEVETFDVVVIGGGLAGLEGSVVHEAPEEMHARHERDAGHEGATRVGALDVIGARRDQHVVATRVDRPRDGALDRGHGALR